MKIFQIVDKIKLHSTLGLMFCLENEKEFCSEMFVKHPFLINPSDSVSLPIKLFAQLPPLKDHPKTVYHKVIFICQLYYKMYFVMTINVF